MESLLLNFTLASFALASIVVMTELIRDSLKRKQLKQKNKIDPALQAMQPPTNPPHQGKLFLLDEKLTQMGYVSTEQQLGFINWVLNSRLRNINEIDAKEIQYLFQTMKRYTSTSIDKPVSDANIAAIVKAFAV